MSDKDAPPLITIEQHDQYWLQLQTDECFTPPLEIK